MSLLLLVIVAIVFWTVTDHARLKSKQQNALRLLSQLDLDLEHQTRLLNQLIQQSTLTANERDGISQVTSDYRHKFLKPYDPYNQRRLHWHLKQAAKLSHHLNQIQWHLEQNESLIDNAFLRHYRDTHSLFSTLCRKYNLAVTELNHNLRLFPNNVVTQITNIRSLPFFEPHTTLTPRNLANREKLKLSA
ncbi:hypothetical protein D5018_05600 [Parashewanella curva]|uniref:LemA family protein n=1 Tax=Parashewanella curva TaxID=2338552 RepID=A0A3L8Q1M9_9GAMM|nr:hypothetical protein [Parashewanella curva]RLV60748.1 hypothetical protein D5018_05600 [Parashewanella curva]